MSKTSYIIWIILLLSGIFFWLHFVWKFPRSSDEEKTDKIQETTKPDEDHE